MPPFRGLTLTAAGLLFIGSFQVCSADEEGCPRNEQKRIDARQGSYPGEIEFAYESRVERSKSNAAFTYIWCIENKTKDVPAKFSWGTPRVPNLYFDTIVLPLQTKAFVTDHFPTYNVGERIIRFRRLDSEIFRQIGVVTIYPRRLGSAEVIRFAQADAETKSNVAPEHLAKPDLTELSKDKVGLKRFLKKEGPVRLAQKASITVPISANAIKGIVSNSYTNYSVDDFVTVQLSILTEISLSSKDSEPILSVYVSTEPSTPEDAIRLKRDDAVSIVFTLSNALETRDGGMATKAVNASKHPPSKLFAKRRLTQLGQELIFEMPAQDLRYNDVTARIYDQKTGYPFMSMPINMLLPASRTPKNH